MNSDIYKEAILKSAEIRLSLGYKMQEPLNIYDVCDKLSVDVRFLDVNMEGLYVNNKNQPSILISSLRPAPRKVFTCAHELGHHIFNDGFKLDILEEKDSIFPNIQERRADAFAAHLLMPILGITAEFAKRNLNVKKANERQFYLISSLFGTGYSTLIKHCYYNKLINEIHYRELEKFTPGKILEAHYGISKKLPYKIFDYYLNLNINLDLELGDLIIVPENFDVDNKYFKYLKHSHDDVVYQAIRVGITNILTDDGANFLRIQPKNYNGCSKYRHLEN
ncbi:MAG: hypothetical protein BGO86_02750 [Chryseobacterium sp. 36-9]|nr:MAG: hypothetical protein BGO86_02750 [Chryseobacterium sp. 36-9]